MFIKNNGRYALAFTINKNGRDVKIVFDKERHYLDTGNLATSGITQVSEEDFELLKKQKAFVKLLGKSFIETDSLPKDNTKEEIALKDKEIADLKKQLAESKKEKQEKDNELASCKEQLESLAGKGSKKKATKTEDSEAEGF